MRMDSGRCDVVVFFLLIQSFEKDKYVFSEGKAETNLMSSCTPSLMMPMRQTRFKKCCSCRLGLDEVDCCVVVYASRTCRTGESLL